LIVSFVLSATLSLISFVARVFRLGGFVVGDCFAQEAVAWTTERFARLETILGHAEVVLTSALALVQAELGAVQQARAELDI
jgi:hypothetical protein